MRGSTMISRRTLTAIGASAAAVALLAGCSSAAPSGGESEEASSSACSSTSRPTSPRNSGTTSSPRSRRRTRTSTSRSNPALSPSRRPCPPCCAGRASRTSSRRYATAELAPELVDLSQYDWARKAPSPSSTRWTARSSLRAPASRCRASCSTTSRRSRTPASSPAHDDGGVRGDLEKLKDAGWTPIQTGGEWIDHALQYTAIPSVIGEDPDWYHGIASGDLTWSDTYA